MENLCKNCGQPVSTPFCGYCGEKVYDNDRSIEKLFNEAFHFITHFEGKFFTTLRSILTRPGKISVDYCLGARKQYFKPVSFFLLLVILYLIFPFFEGLNMYLKYHLMHPLSGESATRQAKKIIQARGIDMQTLVDLFHQKSVKVSKFLLFIMLPVMAVVSYVLAFFRRKYFYDHFIFSIEANSFYILWGFLILPLIYMILATISRSLLPSTELVTAIILLAVYVPWLFMATKRFFKFSNLYTILYCIVYIMALVWFINNIYKFLLFNITIRMV